MPCNQAHRGLHGGVWSWGGRRLSVSEPPGKRFLIYWGSLTLDHQPPCPWVLDNHLLNSLKNAVTKAIEMTDQRRTTIRARFRDRRFWS